MLKERWYPKNQLIDLVHLYNSLECPLGAVVEIGCWQGRSTMALANACHPDNIYCVDTWRGNEFESIMTGVEHPSVRIANERDVYSEFIANMTEHTKGNYKVVKMDCFEWLKDNIMPIKFVHIDACHDYDSVHSTIALLLPHIPTGGIICGDDFFNAHAGRDDLKGGVERAVRESFQKFYFLDNLWFWRNV